MTISSLWRRFAVIGSSKLDQPSSGRSIEHAFAFYQGAGRRRRAAKRVFMPRASTRLEPGERLLLACRPHPAALLPALLRAVAVVLVTAAVLALLAGSSAPDPVRLALDLLAVAFAARAVVRFTRAVWQWDRALLALTTRRVFVVAPRGAVRRAWQTMPLA